MAMKRILAMGCALLCLSAIGIWQLGWLNTPAPDPASVFPDRLTVRLQLPPDESQESSRVVDYADDGITKLRSRIEFKDESTGMVNYRIDGTVSSFSTFYPAEEGESPALKLEGSFGLDGVSLEWEKRYLEDGSLSRSGKRLSSGDYLVQNYESVDNVMVAAAKQVFDAQGNEYETVEFFADGGISKLVMVTEEKGTETTTFTVDGKRVTYHSIKYANIVWLTYREDGETPLHRFEQVTESSPYASVYYIMAYYYRPDGTVEQERKFGRQYMHVTMRDHDGTALLTQQWKHKTPGDAVESVAADQWTLDAVYPGELADFTRPSYYFNADGTFLRHNGIVRLDDGSTQMFFKWYYPDGSVKSYRHPNPATGKYTEPRYEPGEWNEPFDLSTIEELTRPISYLLPPQVPQKTYSYSGSEH